MTQSVTALNDGLRDARVGANPAVIKTLQVLQLQLGALEKMSPEEKLKSIADALNKYAKSPTDYALYARTLGVEGLTPMLRGGSAGITKQLNEARRVGGTVTKAGLAAGDALNTAQAGLGIAIEAVGRAISETLGPAVTPLLEDLTGIATQMQAWITANQTWLQNTITAGLHQVQGRGPGGGLGQAGRRLRARVQGPPTRWADAIGGWPRLGEYVVAFFGARFLVRMLLPFLQLGLTIGRIGIGIGAALTTAFEGAGIAAAVFSKTAMNLPIFIAPGQRRLVVREGATTCHPGRDGAGRSAPAAVGADRAGRKPRRAAVLARHRPQGGARARAPA